MITNNASKIPVMNLKASVELNNKRIINNTEKTKLTTKIF